SRPPATGSAWPPALPCGTAPGAWPPPPGTPERLARSPTAPARPDPASGRARHADTRPLVGRMFPHRPLPGLPADASMRPANIDDIPCRRRSILPPVRGGGKAPTTAFLQRAFALAPPRHWHFYRAETAASGTGQP